MKKWSLQTRITLWYTLFFLLLIGANILIIIGASDTVIEAMAENELRELTDDFAEEIDIENGQIQFDDDDYPNFYEDGVVLVIYQSQAVFAGEVPQTFDANIPVAIGTINRVENGPANWLIYDAPIADDYTVRGFYNTRSSVGIYSEIIQLMVLVAPILLVLAGLGGWIIIRWSLKPVSQMGDVAQIIDATADFKLRVPALESKDDIGKLASIMNRMLDTLEQAYEKEQAFSSNVSHELRTPIAVIKAQTEYLESKIQSSTYAQDFEVIHHQLSHMQMLIEQMLELARLNATKALDLETVDVESVLTMVKESYENLANDKNIQLSVVPLTTPLSLQTHLTFFIRIISNLVDNAIKFTPPGGHVEIKVTQKPSHIIIDVSDTGQGIKEVHQTQIFDALYQVDSARSENRNGIGLGLALTQQMVKRLKGKISVVSKLGKGSTFSVELPMN